MLPSELKEKKLIEVNKPKIYKKISNSFIESSMANSNVNTLKIIYYLATILKKYDYSKKYNDYIVDIKDLLQYTKLTSKNIKNNIKKMQGTSISFVNELENIEKGISLLPEYTFYWDKNRVEITLHKEICYLIINVTKRYTFINTKELMKLKSIHSIKLLPILNMINGYDYKQKTYSLDNLNEIFETKYKSLSRFETNILRKSKQELDLNSSLTFDYHLNFETYGLGRPKAVSITIRPKELKIKKTALKSIVKETLKSESKITKEILKDKIMRWKPNLLEMDLAPKYGIAQTGNLNLIAEFDFYIEEQVIVFKKYCIENNKNYKDMDISFIRHIEGARQNKIDFFANNGFS